MSPDATDRLKQLISQDTRFAQFSPSEIESDIAYFVYKLTQALAWFITLTDQRKIAIIYLCFIIGIHNFLQLKHIIILLENGEFSKAAQALLDIDLLSQAKYYLEQLGKILHTGELHI